VTDPTFNADAWISRMGKEIEALYGLMHPLTTVERVGVLFVFLRENPKVKALLFESLMQAESLTKEPHG
jgi:hypothetical protein